MSNGDITNTYRIRADLSQLKVGFKASTTIKWSENTKITSYTNVSVTGWLIISFCAVFIIHKMKIKRKKIVFLLSIVFCTMLVTAVSMFPIENLFISDKSPEDFFSYSKTGEIKEIIYGQESCMIVYSTNEKSGGYYLVPKTDKGYKIPNYFTAQKVYDRFDGNGLFEIYNVKGTQDFYVFCIWRILNTWKWGISK